jgi:hypothetical protein
MSDRVCHIGESYTPPPTRALKTRILCGATTTNLSYILLHYYSASGSAVTCEVCRGIVVLRSLSKVVL